MTRGERASAIRGKGFNCAQSVFAACADLAGMDEKTALAIAGGFGGGVRSGEVCGAVSGAVMAIGAAFPYTDGTDAEAKKLIAELTVEFRNRFIEKFGALRCSELIGVDMSDHAEMQRAREEGRMSICKEFVETAAKIVEEIVREHK